MIEDQDKALKEVLAEVTTIKNLLSETNLVDIKDSIIDLKESNVNLELLFSIERINFHQLLK